tara:strand:+ start:4716 stop:5231 length:516 start_codon:yes stop_codon:yes gene_type:complete
MLKFFQFSETISGTTFLLRQLFTILLSVPAIIVFISLVSTYMIGEGIIDVNNPDSFDQSSIEEIQENPEQFLSDLWSYMTTGWILSLFIAFLPALWFSLATSYKRISALFYENRNNLFAAYFGFDLINNAIGLGILDSLSFLDTFFSIISLIIFFYLVLKNSDTDKDDHEG